MNQALYAHMNNKRKMKKKKRIWSKSFIFLTSSLVKKNNKKVEMWPMPKSKSINIGQIPSVV
jgi:hypothetical protein